MGSNVEFNAFRSSATLSTGHYEEVDVSDLYNYINDDLVGEERTTTEMNVNIAYEVTKQIETKKNVAYEAVGEL